VAATGAGALAAAAGADAAGEDECGTWLAQPQSNNNAPVSAGRDLDMEHPVKDERSLRSMK
jgi:hypothetical protein